MILSFHIEYRTSWGEEVRVLGSILELGNNQPGKAIPLQTVDGIHWTLDADIQAPENGIVQYRYHIYRDGKDTRTEWNSLPRTLYVSADKKKVYRLQDCWKNLPEQQYFYTSAFTESLLAHPERNAAPKSHKKGLLIKAYAPCIDNDHCLGICGNQKVLGDWDADKAVLMSDANFPEWQVEVDASKISFPLEYKFILYNKKERRAVAWENNPNRYMADPQIGANETLVIGDRYVYFALPDWKGAGVAVPIFSLRSEKSFAIFVRLWRPETDDRLGCTYPPESRTNIAYQRHHHDTYMDGFLSVQQHIHLCVPPHVCRSETDGYVEGQKGNGRIQ